MFRRYYLYVSGEEGLEMLETQRVTDEHILQETQSIFAEKMADDFTYSQEMDESDEG
jgi:hypothetical protein